jgi:RNA 2',3'-cyclic 3'-phosphodiesterase
VRAFVAIDVDPVPEREGGTPAGAPAHLTVQFLGEVSPERVGAISSALREAVAGFPPFDLTLAGVGAFPSAERPRVVWMGATDGADRARALARRVATALTPVGFPPESGDFVPHLTLFRVRSPRDRLRASALLAGTGLPAPRRVRVDRLLLKESELTSGGARHRILETFPLAGERTASS